jgi:hypothetical protein
LSALETDVLAKSAAKPNGYFAEATSLMTQPREGSVIHLTLKPRPLRYHLARASRKVALRLMTDLDEAVWALASAARYCLKLSQRRMPTSGVVRHRWH